jgi:hypothetical protein
MSPFTVAALGLGLGLVVAAGAGDAPLTRILVGRGDTVTGWTTYPRNGSSEVNLTSTSGAGSSVPWTGQPFFNLSYFLVTGQWSASFSPGDDWVEDALNVTGAEVITFSVFNPSSSGMTVTLSIQDAAGKAFGAYPYVGSGWTNLTVPLNSTGLLPAGNVSFPLRAVSVLVPKQGSGNVTAGWIGVADLAVLTPLPSTQAVSDPFLLQVLQPGQETAAVYTHGLPSPDGSPPSLGLHLTNRLPDVSATADLLVRMRASTGPIGEGGPGGFDDPNSWTVCVRPGEQGSTLQPWTSFSFVCLVDPMTASPGLYIVQAVYNGSSVAEPTLAAAATASSSSASLPFVYELAAAVVLPQPAFTVQTRNIHPNVYGGQMIPTAPAAAMIGMLTVREGPLWRWAQPSECFNLTSCFDWSDYDGIFADSLAGLEVMIDAREIAPPWAAAKNDSGPTWAEFPGQEHYAEFQQYLTIMLNRYAPMASSVEVSNEDDGLAFFQPQPIPYNFSIQLSLDLINITRAAMDASPSAAGLKFVVLSTSMFDVKQEGNGGTTYMQYEKAMLSSPGLVQQLDAVSPHPYSNGVWVPWIYQPWGNISFQYANETAPGMATNGTVAQLLAIADLLESEAALAGMTNYTPELRPSEFGYALAIPQPAAVTGWATIHGALIAQGLIHMRSYPLAQYVKKAFVFAGYDGCCEESNTFYGIWRPAQRRSGPNATQDMQQPDKELSYVMPLPAVPAYATASVMTDVPSGRAPGVFVVDNSANGHSAPDGQQLPPTCVAFEPAPTSSGVAPLAVVWITGHHYNDRSVVTASAPGASTGVQLLNGMGTPLPANTTGGAELTLTVTPLPQYVILAQGGPTATAFCESLKW